MVKMSIDSLEIAQDSFSYEDALIFHKLKESLKLFGQLLPVIIQGKKVISGRKIFRAMKENGEKEILVYLAESHNTIGIALALKEIQFETDYIKVSKLIKSADFNPFDEETKEKLLAISEFDWSKLNKPKDKDQVKMEF